MTFSINNFVDKVEVKAKRFLIVEVGFDSSVGYTGTSKVIIRITLLDCKLIEFKVF